MSIDFDSGALQTQQNDNEEYDQEDYAREQLLQQLLTDLPHDMLDDSLCSTSEPNYSDCSDHELSEHKPWHPETQWGDDGTMSDHQTQYPDKAVAPQHMAQQIGTVRDGVRSGWEAQPSNNEDKFTDKYDNYGKYGKEESNEGSFHSDDHYDGPDHCSTGDLYHLPEDFQPYTNGGCQLGENLLDGNNKKNQMFNASEGNGDHPEDSIPVRYNPYQINALKDVKPDATRRLDKYVALQREFLDMGDCSSANMQFVQLQVLYKAKGRQLEELNTKLEESERQLRYLSHQLAIVKDEKDGLALSLQESQTLLQNSREVELQLRGQMAALQNTMDGLTANDEQLRKELKVAKLAMESMQQQVMDLRRSDSINRAREQHEMVVSTLRKKHEEQMILLQQKLDNVNAALQEQKDICSRLEEQLKLAERKQEESKLEKTEMINRLSRSLEESQKQCANLLHTGSIQETTQLRLQLQQLQSSKTISDGMNKAMQEEIHELKEQITMYESAAKLGVFLSREEQGELSDSYVDLGIKKVNWQKTCFQRSVRTNGIRKDLSSDVIITELKTELERCMSSNKTKRQQIIKLQSDLKAYQSKTEELKKLLEKAEKEAKDGEVRPGNFEENMDLASAHRSKGQEIQSLLDENQKLQQEVEKHLLCIVELTASEEKLKAANQQLCSEMREMIQDFDKDKKESIERCERTYEQHHEDIRNHLRMEISEKFEAEKVQLCQTYESNISQLQSQINELSIEMTAVQECYIAVCKEKDTLEETIRGSMRKEFQLNEEKWRDELLEEKEHLLQSLKMELDDKRQSEMAVMKTQWQREKEEEIKREKEIHLTLAKKNWLREQEQVTAMQIQDIENQWKHKLDMTLKHARETVMQSVEDHAVQTEQSVITQTAQQTEQVEDLKMKLHNAMLEKEKAIHKACMELELKHREDISNQVELALTKAHARWIQELTSLSEYKTNLQLEKVKWEKLNNLNIEKQISDAVVAAEEKRKPVSEKSDHSFKRKEYEEKFAALQRELDLKVEEFDAQLKVELGKARAQWNKEKQEEVQAFQAQNEEDFRTFLDDHRTKISGVLATAKADFGKQRNELLTQKEAEMTEQFNKSLKLRISEESKRLHDHDNEILSEMENLMSEIHDELVEKCHRDNHLSHATSSLDTQFLQKLKSYLQRSVKGIVYKVISNTKQEMKLKLDENNETCQDSSVFLRGKERLCNPEGAQKNSKRILMEKVDNGKLQTTLIVDPQLKKKSGSSESGLCENCQPQVEKSKKECQDLRSKLDKACRHLQHAVKEQKLKVEQIKEHETIVEALQRENLELQKKLDEKAVKPEESFPPEEGSKKGCDMCRGKALEEMRSQYIKAVDKIKSDMLRYIHESKARAAEMLKSEVLKERQETARKMRKYYLTCLQQLLKDDGKNEGAEKKIMNAASKLATMAKVLETPISQKTQSRNFRAASLQIKNETEHETSNSDNTHICVSDRLQAPITEQRTIDELIRRHMKEKLDGGKFPSAGTSISRQEGVSKQLRQDCAIAEPVCTLPLEEGPSLNCTGSDAESNQRPFCGRSEPSFLHGLKTYDCQDLLRAKSSRRRFELQEAPVRDNGSNDWSSVSGKGLFPSQSSLTSMKVQSYNQDAAGIFSTAGLFSHVEESRDAFGSRYEGQNHSAHIAKRRDQTPSTWHSSKIAGHPPTAVESKPCSDVGRDSKIPLQKVLLDFASPRQDSGFDSPFPDLNHFN